MRRKRVIETDAVYCLSIWLFVDPALADRWDADAAAAVRACAMTATNFKAITSPFPRLLREAGSLEGQAKGSLAFEARRDAPLSPVNRDRTLDFRRFLYGKRAFRRGVGR